MINEISRYYQQELIGSITGLSLDFDAVYAAGKTGDPEDDYALFRDALAGDDIFFGSRGNDYFDGFAGNDKLKGGIGADKLYGGIGADTFIFSSTKDSTSVRGDRDTIYDFSSRQKDKIDLKAIDANTKAKGNQTFKFIYSHEFHKKAGELRWEKTKGGTYVYGDVNGDGKADFSIVLKDVTKLSKGDFYL